MKIAGLTGRRRTNARAVPGTFFVNRGNIFENHVRKITLHGPVYIILHTFNTRYSLLLELCNGLYNTRYNRPSTCYQTPVHEARVRAWYALCCKMCHVDSRNTQQYIVIYNVDFMFMREGFIICNRL